MGQNLLRLLFSVVFVLTATTAYCELSSDEKAIAKFMLTQNTNRGMPVISVNDWIDLTEEEKKARLKEYSNVTLLAITSHLATFTEQRANLDRSEAEFQALKASMDKVK